MLAVFASWTSSIVGGGSRIDFLAPGVLALAVLSTAFTSLAIGTGFERRYGALKRLGATPLPRAGCWRPRPWPCSRSRRSRSPCCALSGWRLAGRRTARRSRLLVLVVAGTAAFAALALLMAGTLRAEATLAGANLVYLMMLVAGGIAVPLDRFPDGVATALEWLPAAALSSGLREVLRDGGGAATGPPRGPARLGGRCRDRGGCDVLMGVTP